MTHDEIIKALECCKISKCKQCPMKKENAYPCVCKLIEYAIEEIKRLNEAYDEATRDVQRKYAQVEDLRRQINRAEKERDAAIENIPHVCRTCGKGYHAEYGFECDEAHYKGGVHDCISWEWQGVSKEKAT